MIKTGTPGGSARQQGTAVCGARPHGGYHPGALGWLGFTHLHVTHRLRAWIGECARSSDGGGRLGWSWARLAVGMRSSVCEAWLTGGRVDEGRGRVELEEVV